MPKIHYVVAVNDFDKVERYIGQHFRENGIVPFFLTDDMGKSMFSKYNFSMEHLRSKLDDDDIVMQMFLTV